MTGLQKEIDTRKKSKLLRNNTQISRTGLALLLNKPYNTIKRKLENNSFTVGEALAIFHGLFSAKNEFEAFEYLFSEVEDK